ncbi:metal ABC transporter permease [Salinibius halmophilus]|uniref:metal ABC transporter permease n=1 Tax=Salinibius halmophilus TaxID=1853216 RepID=UPI000E65F1A6|nr:metal ABC transporter permease [Salinibius halmophilus]
MTSLFLTALAALIVVILLSAPLGCFVVWRRMAYFGDTLAHAGLLGASLALMANLPVALAASVLGIFIAILLLLLSKRNWVGQDSILGILSHGSLAIGLLLAWVMPTQLDLDALLFGDLLAVSLGDLLLLAPLTIAIGLILWRFWQPLLAITVDRDLACAEGLPVKRLEVLLVSLLAITVAVGIQAVGVLLMTALLITPAATARIWSRTPEQMLLLALTFGLLAGLAGMAGSWWWALPVGPSVVVAALIGFIGSAAIKRKA